VTYFPMRFGLEFFKAFQSLKSNVSGDTTSALTMGQWLSIPFFLLGVVAIVYALKHPRPDGEVFTPQTEPGPPPKPPPKKKKRKRR
jgi:prolipoprotein diacylglyceryltransferase